MGGTIIDSVRIFLKEWMFFSALKKLDKIPEAYDQNATGF
jgi:hypothetical protein